MTYIYTLFRPCRAGLRTVLSVATLSLFVLTGCDSSSVVDAEVSAEAEFEEALAKARPEAPQPVKLFSDTDQVVGESRITRTKKGISFRINTSELTPGHVVTIWTVIFNNPEYCDGPCGSKDFANPQVQADAIYGTGRVVGGSGSATFAGRNRVGTNDGTIFPGYLNLPSPGLIDAEKAEIHFVLRSHGPKIDRLMSEMLKTYNAGCGPEFGGRPVPATLGTYGPNTCEHIQFALHPVTE